MVAIRNNLSYAKNLFWALVLMPFATIATLIITPALPQIQAHYNLSHTADSIIVLAMLGYAFGPILYGLIAGLYGKIIATYTGILLASIGVVISILSYPAHSFLLLQIGRFITTLGAVFGMVVTYAVVARLYSVVEARKNLSLLVISSFAVIPSLVIALGGYITQSIGWIYCLYFLELYALLCIGATFCIPITNAYDVKKGINLVSYYSLLKNKIYMAYISLAGIAVAAVYIYAEKAPIITIKLMGITPSAFGYYNFIPYVAYIISLYISAKYSYCLSYKKIIVFCLSTMSFGGFIISTAYFLDHLNVYVFFSCVFVIFCGSAPIVPNSITLAVKSVKNENIASSFGSFFYMVLASALTWASSYLPIAQSISYPLAILGLVILCGFLYVVFLK